MTGAEDPADDPEDAGDLAELRRRVEAEYDFENFGPEDMAEMSPREWEAAFDPETWITGRELLDRVEADLRSRVADREVFARIERLEDGHVIAYSDEGYAAVHPDGSVDGTGTVLRDVKPTVALCSMESYDAPDAPEGRGLPEPAEVPEGSGELGNLMLQVVGVIQVLAGLVLLGAWLAAGLNAVAFVAGSAFLLTGLFMFVVVANARLSDRFRAEEFRDRLRAAGVDSGERPGFVPVEDGEWVGNGETEPARADPDRRESGTAPEAATEANADGEPEEGERESTP